jgi:hypothetical protein
MRFEGFAMLVALLAGGLGCSNPPPAAPQPSAPRCVERAEVLDPVCDEDGRLAPEAKKVDRLPLCRDLAMPEGSGENRPVARAALVYDALPLRGRSWRSLLEHTDGWGKPPGGPPGDVAGLNTPFESCIPIQAIAGGALPNPASFPCGEQLRNAPRGGRDTNASRATEAICSALGSGDGGLDAVVMLFDHVVDEADRIDDPAGTFAASVVECAKQGVLMQLVAQPGAHRYGYVFGRAGTAASVEALANQLGRLLGDATMHGTSRNALLRSDAGACHADACPPAFVFPISGGFGLARGTEALLSTPAPEWRVSEEGSGGEATRRKRALARVQAERLPLKPEVFVTSCSGAELVVTANTRRVQRGTPDTGVGSVSMSWQGRLGVPRAVAPYPFLTETTSLAFYRPTESESPSFVSEPTWSAPYSMAAEIPADAVPWDGSAAPVTTHSCSAADSVFLAPVIRVEGSGAEVLYWRSRGRSELDAIAAAFPSAGRADALSRELGQAARFGWVTAVRGFKVPGQVSMSLTTSHVELDCATRAMADVLVRATAFSDVSFSSGLCADPRVKECPDLAMACADSAPGGGASTMARFYWELLHAPATSFAAAGRAGPDDARWAAKAVPRLLASMAGGITRRPESAICSNAHVEVGCGSKVTTRSCRGEPAGAAGSPDSESGEP